VRHGRWHFLEPLSVGRARSLLISANHIKVVEIARKLVCVVTMRRLLASLSACLWACGDNSILAPDGPEGPPPFETAPHVSMPRVFGHSNTVLSNVQLVTITFEGYAARDDVEKFGDAVLASSWYTSVGSEYSVLGGTHLQKVVLGPPPASLTRDAIATLLKSVLMSHLAPPPAPTGNQVLYMLYVPPTVARGADLAGIHGYHQVIMLDRVQAPIAVVLDDGTGLATTTKTAGHQLIEAVTNPYNPPTDGYYADLPVSDPWSLVAGEVADLCDGETPVQMDGSGFMVPRVYSNHTASAGEPPCTPFAPGDAWADVSAEPARMQVVPRGGSVDFELTGWSTQPVPDWQLRTRAADFSRLTEEEIRPEFSSDTINNNAKVTLTLHAPLKADFGAAAGVYVLSGPNARPWAVGFFVQ
jgi:hypothetical protein